MQLKTKNIFLLLSIAVLFLSCERVEWKPKLLNTVELEEMKGNWEKLNLKNYSFTYIIGKDMPGFVEGKVEVKNGIGTVSFSGSHYTPTPTNQEDKKYYITKVEDIFENLLNEYKKYKKELDYGKIEVLDYSVRYDNVYFFPKYVYIDFHKPKNPPDKLRGISLTIINFKITE